MPVTMNASMHATISMCFCSKALLGLAVAGEEAKSQVNNQSSPSASKSRSEAAMMLWTARAIQLNYSSGQLSSARSQSLWYAAHEHEEHEGHCTLLGPKNSRTSSFEMAARHTLRSYPQLPPQQPPGPPGGFLQIATGANTIDTTYRLTKSCRWLELE